MFFSLFLQVKLLSQIVALYFKGMLEIYKTMSLFSSDTESSLSIRGRVRSQNSEQIPREAVHNA